jgi:nucleoside-diphosphate-sugar epimerase
MHVLVLGGTRFIGAAAARALAEGGHAVTCVHRGQSQADLPDAVAHLLLDHAELESRLDDLQATQPDLLLDMRPLGEASAQRTMRVAEALGVTRVVAISSCDVYRAYGLLIGKEDGPLVPAPATEDGPLRTRSYPYRGDTPRADDDPARWMDDYDKILAEREFMGHATIQGTVLRLPMVHGPGDYQHRFYPWIRRMADDRPAIVMARSLANWRTCRAHVDEVGRAIALATTDPRAAGRVYNVAEQNPPSEEEWVREVALLLNWSGRLVVVDDEALPESLQAGIRAEQDLTVDSTRIRAELGFAEQLTRAEALAHTVAWERDHPPETPPEVDYEAEDEVLAGLG